MSTTTATASAPKPVEAGAKPAQAGARAQKDKPEGVDIFSSLLSLLANTQVLPEPATAPGTSPGDETADDTQRGPANPLTALMDWGLPGATRGAPGQQTDSTPGLPGAAGSADTVAEGREGQVDISDMTAVDGAPEEALQLDAAPQGNAALPANSLRAGVPFAPATRGTDAMTASTAWRRTSPASTETVALQQASNQAASQAFNQTPQALPMRSTVALNERFGATPGVALAPAERREAVVDGFGQATPLGAGTRASEAAPAPTGAVAGDAALGSDSTGSDSSAFDQTDAQADNPYAEARAADEPTVTHWGTQHLRHASLRVGGEGEQAIDIQLSMKGQEVQVAFNTDSAETRASLRENAGESLSDLLAKSGIQLGGVSVGAQGQQGARGGDGVGRQNGIRGVTSGADTAVSAPVSNTLAAPRADGSQPLDVFA